MKKTLFFFLFILCTCLAFPLVSSAKGCVFTLTENVPIPYSSSISCVNAEHGIYTADSAEDIQYLIDAGVVDNFQEETYYTLFEYEPSDYYFENQKKYLEQIFTSFAWNRNVFGSNVKIAVIDSGLYAAASDFNTKNIIRAYDYTSTSIYKNNDYCRDEYGHGTMVAGIIAAAHNNRGTAGIAPASSLYIYKCFDGNNKAKDSDIISAIYKAVDDYNVDIINMSFGGQGSALLKNAIDYAVSKGALIVAAAGNDGAKSNNVYYPASYGNVISVGSLGLNGHVSSDSQRNDYVNVMAPGENIYSSTVNGYGCGNGTSYAAPHVTAAAALALSLNPGISNYELQDIIYQTCDEMPDRYSGFGSLNIQALLTYVKATVTDDIVYSVNGNNVYLAYILPENCKNYFALYDNDILTNIFSTEYDTFMICDKSYLEMFRHFVWDVSSLKPYKKTSKIQY